MKATKFLAVLGAVSLSACGDSSLDLGGISEEEKATLYRNSTFISGMRIHWASFDADDAPNYNMNNCMMAARLLNSNVIASADAEGKPPHQGVGFWCEPGSFKESGPIPAVFDAEYPTDVP